MTTAVSAHSAHSMNPTPLSEHLVVKNTFLDVVEEPTTRQSRRNSVPASARLASGTCSRSAASFSSKLCRPISTASVASMLSASTRASTCNDPCKSDVLAPFDDDFSDDESTAPTTPRCPPPACLKPQLKDAIANPAATPGLMVPSVEAGSGRTRLSTQANAFRPRIHETMFMAQLEVLVAAVQAALIESGCVNSVEVSRLPQGWSMTVLMRPERFHCKSWVLNRAKEALLQASNVSDSVYVLGYDSQPFAESPLGFAAVLAGMRDQANACWGMYSKGRCHRGINCHWEHPSGRWSLNVIVKPEH